jgi:hypothetical protein
MELKSLSENLNLAKSYSLRLRYLKLFEQAQAVERQSNIIIHQHGLLDSRLNQEIVRKSVNPDLEKSLLPEAIKAINRGKRDLSLSQIPFQIWNKDK